MGAPPPEASGGSPETAEPSCVLLRRGRDPPYLEYSRRPSRRLPCRQHSPCSLGSACTPLAHLAGTWRWPTNPDLADAEATATHDPISDVPTPGRPPPLPFSVISSHHLTSRLHNPFLFFLDCSLFPFHPREEAKSGRLRFFFFVEPSTTPPRFTLHLPLPFPIPHFNSSIPFLSRSPPPPRSHTYSVQACLLPTPDTTSDTPTGRRRLEPVREV